MLNESTNRTIATQPPQLRIAWQRLRESEPGLRARELAERLGVSEGALLASRCGDGITRLEGPFANLIHALPTLGRVMVLTRNDSCVHEKKGSFSKIELGAVMGVVLDEAIDLRIFLNHWKYGFAVLEESRGRQLQSLQFFDDDGSAVHKVYLTQDSDMDAWRRLAERFTAQTQSPLLELRAVAEPLPHRLSDESVDVESLRSGWRSMRDPHDFFALLKKQQLTRTQALRLVGDEFARPVENRSVRAVLESAAASGLPIMVFVGSPGVVQIHTGPVHNIKTMGSWLNVLDDDFNLHLRENHISESWVVQKPTPEGSVTSLEIYDANGGQIVQLFGKRKPGVPELSCWRSLATTLPALERTHA
jgi:putative hemin transport protein